jgi:predicted porin
VKKKLGALIALGACSMLAQAQSNVTVYGSLDQYVGYIKSSNGQSLTALNDGALLRSRIGFRGTEDIGAGYQVLFTLENGLAADTGALAESSRLFDRQAWVGMNTPVGQFRVGRQNTIAFFIGNGVDYTDRATYGSIVNVFGVPARFDNDISYKFPRFADIQVEVHYALSEIAGQSPSSQAVYQLGVDYTKGSIRIGYAGLAAKPAPSGPIQNTIQYHNLYTYYNYGPGKIFFAYVHSNNVTSSAASNDSVGILSNASVPNNYFPGTNPDASRFYNVYQVSADYRISPSLRVGGLYGMIRDSSSAKNDAEGASIGAFYDLSKRTLLFGFTNYLTNKNNAGFRFSGSGAPANLTGAAVNGKRLTGLQVGIRHVF